MIERLPYKGSYPPSVAELIQDGIMSVPTQRNRRTEATTGVDITFRFTGGGLTPDQFREYQSVILDAIEQEAQRYTDYYAKLGESVQFYGNIYTEFRGVNKTWGLHTQSTPETFVYGPGYDVPTYYVEKAFREIGQERYNDDAKSRRKSRHLFRIKSIHIRPHRGNWSE